MRNPELHPSKLGPRPLHNSLLRLQRNPRSLSLPRIMISKLHPRRLLPRTNRPSNF
ncbi:hypothetical protein BDV12DRAFT_167805 [Aspergillus spectabilis]